VSVLLIALTLGSDKQPYQLLRGYASPSYGLSVVVSQYSTIFTRVRPLRVGTELHFCGSRSWILLLCHFSHNID